MCQRRHVAAHGAQSVVHRRSIDGRCRVTFDGHWRSIDGRRLSLRVKVDGHCASIDGHRIRHPVARKLGHLAGSKASIEAAHYVHRVAIGEPTLGVQFELLARLHQTHSARRRLAQSELGGDAVQHGGGSVVAAHAIERAVFAAHITIEDLERRRARLGHCRLGCKRWSCFAILTRNERAVTALYRRQLHERNRSCALWILEHAEVVTRISRNAVKDGADGLVAGRRVAGSDHLHRGARLLIRPPLGRRRRARALEGEAVVPGCTVTVVRFPPRETERELCLSAEVAQLVGVVGDALHGGGDAALVPPGHLV